MLKKKWILLNMGVVKNRKIPSIYELGLYGYYGAISLVSVILSYPISSYFLDGHRCKDLVFSFFITSLSAIFVFVAFFICGGIPLSEWLDEKERNEGNNFDKYIF